MASAAYEAAGAAITKGLLRILTRVTGLQHSFWAEMQGTAVGTAIAIYGDTLYFMTNVSLCVVPRNPRRNALWIYASQSATASPSKCNPKPAFEHLNCALLFPVFTQAKITCKGQFPPPAQ